MRRGVYSPQDLYTFPDTRVGESSTLKVNIRNSSSDTHEVSHPLIFSRWRVFLFFCLSQQSDTSCQEERNCWGRKSIPSKCVHAWCSLWTSRCARLLVGSDSSTVKTLYHVVFNFLLQNVKSMTNVEYSCWMITTNVHGFDFWCVASLIDLQLKFAKPKEPFYMKHFQYSLRWVQ